MTHMRWMCLVLLMQPVVACSSDEKSNKPTPRDEAKAGEGAIDNMEPAQPEPSTEDGVEPDGNTMATSAEPDVTDTPMNPEKPSTDLQACPKREDFKPEVTLTGLNMGARTLSGSVLVKGDVGLYAGEVKIEPGTVFMFESNSSLTIGAEEEGQEVTRLRAAGTDSGVIRFCGKQAGAGKWASVRILKLVEGATPIQHWLIDGAGAKQNAALQLEADIALKDVRILNSGWDGISASYFGEGSTRVTVDGAARDAVSITDLEALPRFPTDSKFVNNKNNVVALALASTLRTLDVQFRALGLPYLQRGNLSFEDSKVSFGPGVEYRFTAGTGLELAQAGTTVHLNVQGDDKQPVLFRGEQEQKGFWRGLQLGSAVDVSSKLSHVTIAHAGNSQVFALTVRSAITVDDVTIRDSQAGAQIVVPLAAASRQLSVRNTSGYPITTQAEALVGLPKGGTFSGNEKNFVSVPLRLSGPAMHGTIPNLGIPYRADALVFTQDKDDITVEAGTQFVFTRDGRFELGGFNTLGKLVAVGTEKAPIVLRGESDEQGSWQGLFFNTTVSPDCRLEYVEVRGANTAVLRQMSVKHSSFSKSPGYGISKTKADPNDYMDTNKFSDNALGAINAF